MTDQPRRLIEVSLPLKAISAQSAREKSIRHGHISTLHIWWARRPLVAMRAAIFASLVPAPESDAERQKLEDLIATIVDWDQVKHGNSPKVLEARQRVLDAFDGRPPRLLDPFMGGGTTVAGSPDRRVAEPPGRGRAQVGPVGAGAGTGGDRPPVREPRGRRDDRGLPVGADGDLPYPGLNCLQSQGACCIRGNGGRGDGRRASQGRDNFPAEGARGREDHVRLVAQTLINILPDDAAERRLLEGFLAGRGVLPELPRQEQLL